MLLEGLGGKGYGELIDCPPELQNRDDRLPVTDRQSIESTLLFATLAVGVEQLLMDDVEAMYMNLHAFNRWLDDDWSINYKDRIFAVPMLSLLDADRAIGELDFVRERGPGPSTCGRDRSTASRRPTRSTTSSGRASKRRTSPSRSMPATTHIATPWPRYGGRATSTTPRGQECRAAARRRLRTADARHHGFHVVPAGCSTGSRSCGWRASS